MKTKRLNIAERLKTDEDIRLFLEAAAEDCSPEEFIHALNTAARAKGMSEVARRAGVTRASLYKSLSAEGNPRFDTVAKIVNSFGCKLAVVDQ